MIKCKKCPIIGCTNIYEDQCCKCWDDKDNQFDCEFCTFGKEKEQLTLIEFETDWIGSTANQEVE